MEPLRPEDIQRLSTKAVYDYNLVMLALNNGNQKAYAELLHRYHESVYFMMMKMCNNKDDAQDLTIEAFGRAFKKLEQYNPEFAFSTWLFKIASNNAIDFLLKKIEESGNHARAIQKIYRQYLEVPLAKFMLKNPQSEISVKISESLVIFE